MKPYCVDSCDEDAGSSSDSSCPATPPSQKDFSYTYDADDGFSLDATVYEDMECVASPCVPSILPQYTVEISKPPEDDRQLSLTESFVDLFAPYREMSHPQCDFNKVLGRLLTEWYAIGASLLATAACV